SDLSNNLFQVTDEWQYTNGRETNRADIMFLINGMPVAIVETKSAKKENGIEEGLIQIREYHHETPEMLTIPQVFNITQLLDFYYGVTWNLGRKNIFNWKINIVGAGPCACPKDFEEKVKQFFDPERFLIMLKEWILFYIKDDELQKTILRQYQSRAVEKIIERCADKVKKTGLIWHTQGSGKTFTMIIAAKQILESKELFGKPTVILMIDRNELEGQLSGWVERILGELKNLEIKIEPATSKSMLQELLKTDFRGLIISMIHKFDGIPKNINTRDNIYVLMDEDHRSVGGDFGNYLVGALPNATLIGFTGRSG
ncbi:DEAD/DEAH box helicase family protein, partial [Candidatus Desantisbacteria bacterium]|nr:DEAD/DEAH box helicase family protein [Candidatus Desantisbacteria bacterium]